MSSTPPSRDDLAALVDRLFHERTSWPELIKSIRGSAAADLPTALKIALSHPGWRRFCNEQINSDRQCRKQAMSHIRSQGPDALIALDGMTLRVIEPAKPA